MITTVYDSPRGCGSRKKGGMYLMSDPGPLMACCKMPIALTVCPCCGEGIKFSRGWSWVDVRLLNPENIACSDPQAGFCPVNRLTGKIGLLWVGEKFYTPDSFSKEANILGVSKRIANVPKDLKLGETWVALAHIKVVNTFENGEPSMAPGIFRLFKPSRIEYVTTGEETPEEIEAIEKRGIIPVKVEEKQGSIFSDPVS